VAEALAECWSDYRLRFSILQITGAK
jgi:hypothetical protein